MISFDLDLDAEDSILGKWIPWTPVSDIGEHLICGCAKCSFGPYSSHFPISAPLISKISYEIS